jgi:hypothetical protein
MGKQTARGGKVVAPSVPWQLSTAVRLRCELPFGSPLTDPAGRPSSLLRAVDRTFSLGIVGGRASLAIWDLSPIAKRERDPVVAILFGRIRAPEGLSRP